MSTAHPFPRDTRERFATVAVGQTVFGPFDFLIFDVEDVSISQRPDDNSAWSDVSGATVSLTGAAPAYFTVEKTGLAAGVQLRIKGARTHERRTDVVRAGVVNSKAMETQFDMITVIMQELRRDGGEAVSASQTALELAIAVQAMANAFLAAEIPPGGITSSLMAPGAAAANLGYTPAAFAASRAAAAASSIPAAITALHVYGREVAGDGGAGIYLRQSSQPSHAAKFQSQDGGWWALSTREVTAQQVGVIGAFSDNATLAAADAAAVELGGELVIDRAHNVAADITFASHVRFRPGGRLVPAAGVKIDFGDGFSAPVHYRIFDFSAAGSGLKNYAKSRQLSRELYPQQFGGPDLGNDSDLVDAAFAQWIAACKAARLPGFIPAGMYRFADRFGIDMGDCAYDGLTIAGAGRQTAILNFVPAVLTGSEAAFYIQNTTVITDVPAGKYDFYYPDLSDFGVRGVVSGGPVFRLGRNDGLDPVNEPVIRDIQIQQFATDSGAIGTVLNYVLGLDGNFQSSCAQVAGNGFGLRCRNLHFSRIKGSFGTGAVGVHLTDGANQNNEFFADMENVSTCVQVDGPNCVNNLFNAGTWNYYANGYFDAAGSGNQVNFPGANPSAPATLASFLTGNGTGVTIRHATPRLFPITTPGWPGFGNNFTNNTAQPITVELWWSSGATTVSSFLRNSEPARGIANALQYLTFTLNPGDIGRVNGSGTAPTWYWSN